MEDVFSDHLFTLNYGFHLFYMMSFMKTVVLSANKNIGDFGMH